jgi:transporter family protein
MSWILIAISAQLLYGASAFVDRFLIERHIKNFLFLTILGGLLVFLLGIIITMVNGLMIFSPFNLALLLVSGIFYEIALLPYYKAISLEDASRVTPLFQMIPIFVLLFSILFLNEVPTINEFAGFILILIGGFMLSVEKLDLKIFRLRKFFWYMVLSSILYSLPGVMFKYVVIPGNFWGALSYEFIGAGIGAGILMAWSYLSNGNFFAEIPNIPKKVWGIICVNEGIYILARFFTYYAIMLGPVFLVAALGGSGPFFTFLYGLILSVWFPQIIKEDIRRPVIIMKLTAITLIFLGTLLINPGGY